MGDQGPASLASGLRGWGWGAPEAEPARGRDPLKVLGHIHTFNDADVIDRSIEALSRQTFPLPEILLVDNASTDDTLDRRFPDQVTVIKHQENLGTSGAVFAGFQYALQHGYDWIWILDADSAPRPDALETLIRFYRDAPEELRDQIWLLASLRVEDSLGKIQSYEIQFTDEGHTLVEVQDDKEWYEFDSTIWSGSLYKLSAAAEIGLPGIDYVLDWGEYEYGYRGRRQGYRAFLHRNSVVYHNIGGAPALRFETRRVGPWSIRFPNLPAIRCYYLTRNLLYFYFYIYADRGWRPRFRGLYVILKFTGGFVVRPIGHRKEAWACLRGIRDGILGKLRRRF